jgi:molecular chaperone GrpE (heat shock protein)
LENILEALWQGWDGPYGAGMQATDDSAPATKGDLRFLEEKLAKKLDEQFATKGEMANLRKELKIQQKEFMEFITDKTASLEDQIEGLRDDMRDMREDIRRENAALVEQVGDKFMSSFKDELETVKDRVTRLERHPHLRR